MPFVDTYLARGIGRAKVSPQRVAAEIIDDIRRERLEIRFGQSAAPGHAPA